MHGRILATTDEIIAVVSPGSDQALSTLESWTEKKDIGLAVVDVGENIDDVYNESRATLGITLGGDGTFLEGIKTFAPREIPLIGVNTGTLSFLARIEPHELDSALDEVIRGRALVDSRQQVYATARGLEATGINDVMVQHVPPENPIERKITRLEVFADDEYVGEFEGTGLAVSTPTGSTGIALSANGPIHYPVDNHSLQLVPLHTHQMGVRPVVVSPATTLRIVTRGQASLLIDGGRAHTILREGEEITVTGAEQQAHLVRTSFDDHFFTALANKLGWNVRTGDDMGPRDLLAQPEPPTAENELEKALEIAKEAAQSVGDPLRKLHGQVESITVKTDKADIVTEADHQADRIITTVIENEFPDHGIFSEESERKEGDSKYTWLIDPLDGTGNFAHGNPNYSVSIALLDGSKPVLGVVYVPETDEMFSASTDHPAQEDGSELTTTDRDELDESMLLSGYDPDGTFLTHFYEEARGVRRLGSAALNLCYLASGSADAVWEYDTYPWDIAAGLVIANSAGAKVTNLAGEEFDFSLDTEPRAELLASNGPLHPALLSHIKSGDPDL